YVCVRGWLLLVDEGSAARRDLHSFPTRRSSDLFRINSPKPGRSLSQTASVASGVTSRRAGPVPPVVITRQHLSRSQSSISTPSIDRKSTRLNSSHVKISYAVFCLKKKSTGRRAR